MTKEISIEERNALIADFMQATNALGDSWDKFKTPKELKYHSSWDWLKPVIDEIFNYALAYPEQVAKIRNMSVVVEIGAAWEKVVQFIVWFNNQQAKKQ